MSEWVREDKSELFPVLVRALMVFTFNIYSYTHTHTLWWESYLSRTLSFFCLVVAVIIIVGAWIFYFFFLSLSLFLITHKLHPTWERKKRSINTFQPPFKCRTVAIFCRFISLLQRKCYPFKSYNTAYS